MSVIDESKLEEFMGRMVGNMTAATACFAIWLGDELGLYKALAQDEAQSSDEVAGETGCNPRLVREWLDGQAAAGLIRYDSVDDRYSQRRGGHGPGGRQLAPCSPPGQ